MISNKIAFPSCNGVRCGHFHSQSPPPPLHTLLPLFFHTLPLSAPHSRTPEPMYAFGLTYTLPLLPSFPQKMMMNCWMHHRTSTCLFPPQLAALSLIWNKLSTTCTLPPLHRYLLIPFFILPFPVCPSFFFFNRWLQRISRILAVLGYEGIKKATPVVLHPKRKSSAHSL